MNLVYHPAEWSARWPSDAKPYATKELALAHGHAEESLVETPYNGPLEGVCTEPPSPVTAAVSPEATIEGDYTPPAVAVTTPEPAGPPGCPVGPTGPAGLPGPRLKKKGKR